MNRPEKLSPAISLHLASRMEGIEPFHVVVLVNRAKELEAQGRSIANMVVGEPDAPTPPLIAAAGIRAIEGGRIGYTSSLGITELRDSIHWYHTLRRGSTRSRVVVTACSSGALLLTMGALLSPGDQVLIADPGYPCNRHFVRTMEGEAVGIPVGADTAYQLTANLVEKYWSAKTVAVLIASLSNPTGTLIDHDELKRIHAVVRARGGVLIVDEIYHGLTYGKRDRSALEFADDVFIINSFSKYFGMTGWRLGWMVAPNSTLPRSINWRRTCSFLLRTWRSRPRSLLFIRTRSRCWRTGATHSAHSAISCCLNSAASDSTFRSPPKAPSISMRTANG
jgi:aspartate/methionine/tyrosine aminotransferase